MKLAIVVQRYGWGALAEEWSASWPRIATVGFLSNFAYVLVLTAIGLWAQSAGPHRKGARHTTSPAGSGGR